MYGRVGDFYFRNFWGAGATVFSALKTRCVTLDATAHIWNQPSLHLQDNETKWRETPNGTGGSLTLALSYHPNVKRIPFFLTAQAGYKTDGFLAGEHLARGFSIRAGLGFRR